MAKGPTLKDIAERAGVAVMTVSRALRDSPKISLARRGEIQALAKAMGYQPDPHISRLMSMLRTARSRRGDTVIAVITTLDRRGEHKTNLHQGSFYRGVEARAKELGFKLEEFWVNEREMRLERLEGILEARGIEGLLLMPYGIERRELGLNFDKFAVAAVGRSQSDQTFHRACQNHYRAVQVALKECEARGYGRVGMVISERLDERAERRYSSAFLHHLHVCRPSERVPLLERAGWDEAGFLKWFERHRPEVVVATSRVVRELIAKAGLSAPRDYGFVNLDLIDPKDRSAGVNQNYGLVGASSIDLLASQLNHNERGLAAFPKTVLVDGYWQEGDSLKPAKLG